MLECNSVITQGLSALTVLFTAGCAFASFWLAKRIYREAKSDERLVFGPLDHPRSHVKLRDHYESVIGCIVFNKAQRKAYIESVRALSITGNQIEVSWSDSIDDLGNTNEPGSLIGIVDVNNLYVRKNDGSAFEFVRLEIYHSFPDSPSVVEFDWFSHSK